MKRQLRLQRMAKRNAGSDEDGAEGRMAGDGGDEGRGGEEESYGEFLG